MLSRVPFVLLSALAAGACARPLPVDASAAALTVPAPIDAMAGAQIVGASADRRFVAYAGPCTPDQQDSPQLRLHDDWTGAIFALGVGQCRPDSVRFSPDGRLAAFGGFDGIIRVFSARTGALTAVSRAGQPGIALSFSPDSRWLVVASHGAQSSTLDAWDADLVHHVEISPDAFINPFIPDAVRFSPDSARILFIAGVTTPFPLGALTQWERASRRPTVLAEDVAIWTVSDDFARIAYLGGVRYVPDQPPSVWMHGALAVRRLGDGHVDTIARDVAAQPIAFSSDGTLVYFVGPPGQPVRLDAVAAGGHPVTIDDGVFAGWGGLAGLAIGSRGDLAYVAHLDQQRFAAELRVATLPGAGRVASAPVVVATDAVPTAFGWADAATLVYLHAPTTSYPGAQVGTLSSFGPGGARSNLADGVTQVGLRFDSLRDRVLYVAAWDANRAAGDLSLWSARTRRHRLLDHDAFVMTLALSPDGDSAGVLTVGHDQAPGTPPPTAFDWMPLDCPASANTVSQNVTSFAISDGGRVLYTTSAGLYGAFTF